MRRVLLLLLAGLALAPIGCGDSNEAPPTVTPPPDGPAEPSPSFTLDADRVFGPVAADVPAIYADPTTPTWFLLHMKRGSLASVSLGPPEAAEEDDSLEITVVAYRTHPGPVALRATWAGKDLGTQTSDPALVGARVELHFDVPPGTAPTALNAFDLQDVSPPLPKRSKHDVSKDRGSLWIDSIRAIVVGHAERVPSAGRATKLGNFDLLDVMPSNVEHLIVAVPDLMDEARRLAVHRTATGTPSAVFDATTIDLPDTPQIETLKALISLAAQGGKLRYVVLAGDATLDRTDLIQKPTIPAPMTRTMYNGATASDHLYLGDHEDISIGRLPFRTAAEMRTYVDRVIQYETSPPAHPSRRMLRFVTNEGRFGTLIDNAIEHLFRGVLAEHLPPAFDVEVTFASANSPFLWPPREMNRKVIDSLNEGSMYFTYVGHGFQFGFDSMRIGRQRFPILHVAHVPRIDIQGTPPVAFVLACTTAQFDDIEHDGVGEALLKRPRGPIAYWGASRVCHPIANSLVGYTLAKHTARLAKDLRLGDLIRRAWQEADTPNPPDAGLKRIRLFSKLAASGVDVDRLVREGREMYSLLGDPALKLAYPADDLVLTQLPSEETNQVTVRIAAPLPDGTVVNFSLEKTRDQTVHERTAVTNVLDPKQAATIRENHRRSNDWSIHRQEVVLKGGEAVIRLTLEGTRAHLVAKAWTIAEGDVHQGAVPIE